MSMLFSHKENHWKTNLYMITLSTIVAVVTAMATVYSGKSQILLAFAPLLLFVIFAAIIRHVLTVILLTVWIACQNTMIPVLYAYHPNVSTPTWTTMLSVSQVAAILVVLIHYSREILYKKKLVYWSGVAIIFSTIVLALSVIHKSESVFSTLNSARTLLVPVLYIWIGRIILESDQDRNIIIRLFGYLSIFGAILALFDAFALSGTFWEHLKMGQYWINVKHLTVGFLDPDTGLPGNFYENYGGKALRRALSFYGDPLAAGYSMAFGFGAILMLLENKRYKLFHIIALIAIVAGIAVTYTRTAYIIVFIEFLAYYFYRKHIGKPLFKAWILILPLPFILLAGKVLSSTLHGTNGSAQIHLNAIKAIPVLLTHPIGFGAGASGGPEGTYLEIWWQFGIITVVLFVLLLCQTYRSIATVDDKLYRYMMFGILTSLIVSGFISQEMDTDTACAAAWILIGASWRSKEQNQTTMY